MSARSLRRLGIVAASTLVAASMIGIFVTSGSSATKGTSAHKDTVTITWSTWGSPSELKRFKEFNDWFMKRHPNIHLVLQSVPSYGDYHPKLLTELAAHKAPDVFYIGDDNIGKFVSANVLTPLNSMLTSKQSRSKPSQFYPGLWAAAKKNGTIYGVPTDDNPEVLWYDKKALKDAGITEDPATLAAHNKWTMAKFLSMTSKLKAAGKAGAAFYNWFGDTYSFVSSYGGKVYNKKGQWVLTRDPRSLKALKMLARNYQNKTFLVADLLPDAAGSDTQFLQHKIGFYGEGRYTIGTVKSGGDPQNYDIVRFPSVSGKPTPSAVAAAYLAINKDTAHPKEAFTFLTEFVGKAGQIFRLQGGGNAVPSIKGADKVVLEGYPKHARTFLDLLKTGFEDYPEEMGVPGLTLDINNELLKLWTGKESLTQARTNLDKIVSKALGPKALGR